MSATITWKISQLDRQSSDGLVFTSHWRVVAEEDGYTAETYGSMGHERADEFIPYEDLTEQEVIGWVKAKLDVASIESSLQDQINAKKAPATLSGVPWPSTLPE